MEKDARDSMSHYGTFQYEYSTVFFYEYTMIMTALSREQGNRIGL